MSASRTDSFCGEVDGIWRAQPLGQPESLRAQAIRPTTPAINKTAANSRQEHHPTFHGVGVAVGSARPVMRDTATYSAASGLPLLSFPPAMTSVVPFIKPSKTPSRTFVAGASTSPFVLNFKHRNTGVLPVSGVKVNVGGGLRLAGSAKFDRAALPDERIAVPVGSDFKLVSCFATTGFAGS